MTDTLGGVSTEQTLQKDISEFRDITVENMQNAMQREQKLEKVYQNTSDLWDSIRWLACVLSFRRKERGEPKKIF